MLLFFVYINYYPEREFSAETWHVDKEKRYEMTSDLIENRILIGKTKKEISDLLGKDYYTYSADHWVYEIVHVPGLLNIDPDVLDIYFEDDKVVRVDQHES